MGMWDFEAWDNDSAADWFGELMDETKLRDKWRETIDEIDLDDVDDEPEIARAAIWLFAQLGRVYIWPINHYDDDLKITIEIGERLVKSAYLLEEVPEYVSKLQADLDIIKARQQ